MMNHQELFSVEGLMCGTCLVEVLERLHRVDGVEDVGISLRVGGRSPVVVVRGEALVPPEALASAVTEAGFTMTDSSFRALPVRQDPDNLRHDRGRTSADRMPIGGNSK
ncbi:heavy metal-associated domain-containing protein [Demequina sp.]|uniref:heavy-metal-associated domain-containing protein n=1 Tax=Demequina sp. TaxID=2050685 RepID=UPI0025C66176|nr:heavy metal-associated domain-containing protein [Demequina sp.]